MKKLMTMIAVIAVSAGALGAVGCKNPCNKAADKLAVCLDKAGGKAPAKADEAKSKKAKETYVASCKDDKAAKKKAKDCLKIEDCDKFLECLNTQPKRASL